MASQLVSWDRLVRYIPAGESKVKYGVPILSGANDDVAKLASKGQLKVKVCKGNDALNAIPTEQVETVKTLLGPLDAHEVPIIRCIGLNYKTHSKSKRTPIAL
jgi:hypothetical protein